MKMIRGVRMQRDWLGRKAGKKEGKKVKGTRFKAMPTPLNVLFYGLRGR